VCVCEREREREKEREREMEMKGLLNPMLQRSVSFFEVLKEVCFSCKGSFS